MPQEAGLRPFNLGRGRKSQPPRGSWRSREQRPGWWRRWWGRLALGLLALALAAPIVWYGIVVPISLTFPVFGLRRVDVPERVVALTYDDGPEPPYTEQLLDILAKNDTKATFFSLGFQIDRYPSLAQKVLNAGHQLGNHSYSHRALVFKAPQEIWREVASTDERLQALGETGTIAIRPPFGKRFLILPAIAWRRGQPLILWDLDSGDWQAETTTDQIVATVLGQVQPGSIVLMHDGRGDRSTTVAASARLIPALKAQGYRFVTVAELLALRQRASIANSTS